MKGIATMASNEIAALPTPQATALRAMRWQRRGAPQMVSLGFAEPIDGFAPKSQQTCVNTICDDQPDNAWCNDPACSTRPMCITKDEASPGSTAAGPGHLSTGF